MFISLPEKTPFPLFISILFLINQTLVAQNCAAGLKYVKESYSEGRFWNCIDTIESCLKKDGYNREEKIVALSFKAKVYLAIDSVYKAREIIQSILVLRDNYEPAVDDPDRYKNLFAAFRHLAGYAPTLHSARALCVVRLHALPTASASPAWC